MIRLHALIALASFMFAWFLSHACGETSTAWFETTSDGLFAPACGDEDGNRIRASWAP